MWSLASLNSETSASKGNISNNFISLLYRINDIQWGLAHINNIFFKFIIKPFIEYTRGLNSIYFCSELLLILNLKIIFKKVKEILKRNFYEIIERNVTFLIIELFFVQRDCSLIQHVDIYEAYFYPHYDGTTLPSHRWEEIKNNKKCEAKKAPWLHFEAGHTSFQGCPYSTLGRPFPHFGEALFYVGTALT